MHYKIISGDYAAVDDNGDILYMTQYVGLLYSTSIGICLLKHGRPAQVLKSFEKLSFKYKAAGLVDESNSLVFIVGRFDVDELNSCLDNPHRILKMISKG